MTSGVCCVLPCDGFNECKLSIEGNSSPAQSSRDDEEGGVVQGEV